MPEKQLNANIWFYQDFLAGRQDREFWPNQAQDWSRLRVWDGNALQPAMGADFQGLPTPEQVLKLYEHAQQGNLFYFELGNHTPRQVGIENQEYVNMNPREPVMPQKPDVDETDSLMVSYIQEVRVYEHNLVLYQKNKEEMARLGKNFWKEVTAYNKGRDMQQEATEQQAHILNEGPEAKLRNREKADRVIDQLFGPKPMATPEVFYKRGHSVGAAVIRYELFDQFQNNAYDVPQNSKLSETDIATINFAMLGAKEPVIQTSQEKLGAGPLNAKYMATNEFQMLATGLFGQVRPNQELVDSRVAGDVLKMSKDAIEKYNQGDYETLGKHLGECVRTIKDYFVSSAQDSFTQDLVAGTRLIERLQDLFERKPDLLQAAGLNDNEKEFMHGYSQMGKVYENYLHAQIKMNNAAAHGTPLTTEEKAQILTDALIRRIVEKELTKDKQRVVSSDEFLRNREAAEAKDEVVSEQFLIWQTTEMRKLPLAEQDAAQAKYLMQHDYNMNRAFADSLPVDHEIIQKLAQPGMLENLRQRLQNDPIILAEAGKEPVTIGHNKLFQSNELDKLADYAAVTNEQKQAWFNNMKAMVTGGQEGQNLDAPNPWLNAGVETDISRLKIAVSNDRGGKDLVNLESLLDGGLQELENPSEKALNLMYQNAMDGNLYYYEVGKDMPKRLSADGEQAAAQQLKVPATPNLLQRIIHAITGGRFFADICNPRPDRDPAAMEKILDNRYHRNLLIANEASAHRRIQESRPTEAEVEQAQRTYADRVKEDVDNFRRIPDQNTQREFPAYDDAAVKNQLYQNIYGNFGGELGTEKSVTEKYILDRLGNENATPEMCREAMAAAVLLELVKEQRIAGNGVNELDASFNMNHTAMVNGFMNNETFQAFTENASVEMLKHFIMVGGARNMYQAIKNVAENRANQQELGLEPNALENNLRNQAGMQNVGMG